MNKATGGQRSANRVPPDDVIEKREWASGLVMTDVSDAILVEQHGRRYKARKWRLTQQVVDVVDLAVKHGLTANWVDGHPSNAYCNLGTEFERGIHHITFARDHREGWIFVLGGESKPPNFGFVTFNHRYGAFIHRTKIPYRWEHSGGHNVYVSTSNLAAVLELISNDVIDEVEAAQTGSARNRKALPRASLADEFDLELAFLDHLGRLPETSIGDCEVRPRLKAAGGATKIPDILVDVKGGPLIVVELKFPHGIYAHVDQLDGYLKVPSLIARCTERALHGILIAREFREELVSQIDAGSILGIALYRYGFDGKLLLDLCAGRPVLEESGLLRTDCSAQTKYDATTTAAKVVVDTLAKVATDALTKVATDTLAKIVTNSSKQED